MWYNKDAPEMTQTFQGQTIWDKRITECSGSIHVYRSKEKTCKCNQAYKEVRYMLV